MREAGGCEATPGFCTALLRVSVIAPVLWCGLVRKDLVENHIVTIHVVAEGTADGRRTGAEITGDCGYCDIEHVISESPAVGPAAWDYPVTKSGLDKADKNIAAEY